MFSRIFNVLVRSGEKFVRTKLCQVAGSSVCYKSAQLKPCFTDGTYIDFYPYLPHFLTDLDEIRYKISAHNAVELCSGL